jgi:hypothetical protein
LHERHINMFKKSLLIIGLALSLNTHTHPFTYKNQLRSLSMFGTLVIGYVGFSMAMGKYLTHTGLQDLTLSGSERCAVGIGLVIASAGIAGLFQHAETIK